MTQDTIQKRTANSWIVCQKCKSPEAAEEEAEAAEEEAEAAEEEAEAAEEEELLIPPKQRIILCEECLLHYSKIFPIEDREFVRETRK
jgi:hypothetical protein